MSAGREDPAKDLSGAWRGMYAYAKPTPQVAFEATLVQTGWRLSGVTEEIGQSGKSRGQILTATLEGRRDGASVSWRKRYDDPSRAHYAIDYEGDVSADGNEISGRWTIPGNWSGTFLMIRASSLQTAVEREETARV